MGWICMLQLNNIEVIYNDVILVFKGFFFKVEQGQIVVFLGINGVGKLMMFKVILGFFKFEDGVVMDGNIEFEGECIDMFVVEDVVCCGIFQVMEGCCVFEYFNIEENLFVGVYMCSGCGGFKNDIEQVYGYFLCFKECCVQQVGFFLGGEQQMFVIGCVMMVKFKVMLFDELLFGFVLLFV